MTTASAQTPRQAASPFERLRRRLAEIDDLEKTARLLCWDEQTTMPAGGAEARAEQRATLQRLAHELHAAPQLGELLEQLRGFEAEHAHDSFQASLIRVARRDYEKAVHVPAELRAEITRAGSRGYRAWLEAVRNEDFGILQPHLERRLQLAREYSTCFAPVADPCDPLLDDHEPGMTTATVEVVFDRLKQELVPLLAAVAEQEPIDDSCLHGCFPTERQRRFARALLERVGLDANAWRLDNTAHPFALSLSPSDIRLATNFSECDLTGVFSSLHEFGHGLYEHQLDPAHTRTPLAAAASTAFHESQSRLWENLIGRNLSTWRYLYPLLQQAFPAQLANVPLETFHRALNKVQPTSTRCGCGIRNATTTSRADADELTYNLHIILRFELERELLSTSLDVADLPQAFDAKMQRYLGLRPANIVEGVLQDTHWAQSSLGYFPTYALGNVISTQLWERARADLGDLDNQLAQGEYGPLRDWLAQHVHRFGRTLTPAQLLTQTTGRPLDPEPYLTHLHAKLSKLYPTLSAHQPNPSAHV